MDLIKSYPESIKIGDVIYLKDADDDFEFISKVVEFNEKRTSIRITDLIKLSGVYECKANQWEHNQGIIILQNFGNVCNVDEDFREICPEFFI